MVKATTLITAVALLLSASALAQEAQKGDIFVGAQVIHAAGTTQPGFIGSATFNAAPMVGLTAQVSVVRGFGGAATGYAIMVGPTIFPVGRKRVSPFIDALGGGAFASSGGAVSPGYFAFSLGGGLDASVSDRAAVRFGVDWMHVPAFGASAARAYVGLVFHF